MKYRYWKCPKCLHEYRWHQSNTEAAHRCNPAIPRVTALTLTDDDIDDEGTG